MGYIDQNLVAGETVVYRTHLHWTVFLAPVFWLFVALFALAANPQVGAIILGGVVLVALWSYIEFVSSEFGLTNKRVLVKVGFVRRHTVEMQLSKVESIAVNQGIFGRIFGYGTLVITGSGGTREVFHRIAMPLEFRKRVQEEIA